MPLDPDTEIQYRRGGKIMKKTPRKFQAGGAATPAPATKPAPKGGPKELQDEAEKMRQEKLDEAQRKAGQRRPDLSKPFKKGGAVRKFNGEEESFVGEAPKVRERGDRFFPQTATERSNAAYKNDPESPGDTGSLGRFEDETYRRAYEQANRLREPSGAEVKEVKANTGLKEPSVRKAAPKRFAPKPAPKAESKPESKPEPKAAAPKPAPKKDYGAVGGGNMRRSGDFELSSLRPRSEEKEVNQRIKEASVRRSRAEDIYPSLGGKKAGGVVKKYAKGGGVEAKGKTKGKIVKMATGGSVRGYGVSKVTNKTKYC
jgi:hypothetical protein